MRLWTEGSHDEIRAYGTCDVATLTLAFARLGVHTGWCTQDEARNMEVTLRGRLETLSPSNHLYRTFMERLDAESGAAGTIGA